MVEAVIFAMVAVFLGFRLYSVLGKRSGHEQSYEAKAEEVRVPPIGADVLEEKRETPRVKPMDEPLSLAETAGPGLKAITAADPSFHIAEFLAGSEFAYRMILERFWAGDLEGLTDLTNEDVRAAFAEAIAARESNGHQLDNRLVRVERSVVTHASLEGKIARITVRYDADIAAVTRDKKGKVIAGSLTDAIPTHDVWTFERDVKSRNPNWTLIDTDEGE